MMNIKLKIGLILTLVGIFIVGIWFFWNTQNVHLSGKLEYNPYKVIIFSVDGKKMISNPEAGITRDVLVSYSGKNIEVEGKIITITEGVASPKSHLTQIGTERKMKVVLPKNIRVIK
jgi:hypothetical protein